MEKIHLVSLIPIAFLLANAAVLICGEEFLEVCDSPIYCLGDPEGVLATIQLNHLYEDDKTFVDFALKHNATTVVENFEALNITGHVGENATLIARLREFVEENFLNGTEFEEWEPSDWDSNPPFLQNISDPQLRDWADDLHSFWKELGRKIKDVVNTDKDLYSMYYVSNPVIVPGGRFKEFYYWDSYWIQKGLIISGMKDTVRGMIENFVEMITNLSYIPNGGRIYYERTQPPLFIPMVKNYYDATRNSSFIVKNVKVLEQEFQFFMNNRTVTFEHKGKNYTMARYYVPSNTPRPESYSDDYELVAPLNVTDAEKHELYSNLKSGAESGWDFSSRWFVVENDSQKPNLSHVRTRDIIPVDLNGFLYWNAVILAEFCNMTEVSCERDASYYKETADNWKVAIHDVLWDEEAGSWFDYDYRRAMLRKKFYPTNVVPLWVKAHHTEAATASVLQYFRNVGALAFPGGIPSSMEQSTGQQWDFPNGWAPLNHMVVEAFQYSGNQEAEGLAYDLALRWTRTNYKAYVDHNNTMFEKYDVTCLGCAGGGGEYEVVVGFGWTNGVVLDFLTKYGQEMTPSSSSVLSQNYFVLCPIFYSLIKLMTSF